MISHSVNVGQGPSSYVMGQYYSGILHGWITYYEDSATGTKWWLDANQWRYWDGQTWRFAHVRTYNSRSNTWGGAVLGAISLTIGIVVGGPMLPIGAVFGLFCLLLGMGNSRIRNRHPEIYPAVVVASALLGAQAIYSVTHQHKRD